MNKKLAKELSQPFMIIGLIVMLVMGAVIMWFNMYVGLAALFVAAAVYFFHQVIYLSVRRAYFYFWI